jgi:hypothetical protein
MTKLSRWLLSLCAMFCLCLLSSASRKTTLAFAQNEPTAYVPASKSVPQYVHLLDQKKDDLDRVLDLYNYNLKTSPWEFEQLKSPLVKKDAIFRFESIEVSEGSSVFVAIIPAVAGDISIIPLWYHGLRPAGNPELDPHNIAVFNALVTRERPILKTDSHLVNLAVLYLYFFEERPKILEGKNVAASLGKLQKQSMLPDVKLKSDGGSDVRLFEQNTPDKFTEINFSFDSKGILRSLTEDSLTKAEILGR